MWSLKIPHKQVFSFFSLSRIYADILLTFQSAIYATQCIWLWVSLSSCTFIGYNLCNDHLWFSSHYLWRWMPKGWMSAKKNLFKCQSVIACAQTCVNFNVRRFFFQIKIQFLLLTKLGVLSCGKLLASEQILHKRKMSRCGCRMMCRRVPV